MIIFYQSLPRDAKSPIFAVRLALDGIRMPFLEKWIGKLTSELLTV